MSRVRGRWRMVAATAALALMAVIGSRGAFAAEPVRVRAGVAPATAHLGERLTYRGMVTFHGGAGHSVIRWSKPDSAEALVWGELRTRYARGDAPRRVGGSARLPARAAAVYDTAHVEVNLQIFDTGVVPIPGIEFEVQEGSAWKRYRLPVVQMPMVPVVTAADSNAKLRPLRGPLAAPWWERVPWLIVLGALALLGITFLIWRRLRKRRLAQVRIAVPALAELDPFDEAMRELAALRKLQLPDAGRFADHALALTRILRRFLERTRMTPRPGHTTPEIIAVLGVAGFDADQVARISSLLGYWDRLKFARAETGIAEAAAAEDAVEAIVRAGAPANRAKREAA